MFDNKELNIHGENQEYNPVVQDNLQATEIGITPLAGDTATTNLEEFNPLSHEANKTYIVKGSCSGSGIQMKANVTLIFAGGIITGSGTLTGLNTRIVAAPVQIFDNDLKYAGSWKVDKVYAENFGDTDGSESEKAINKALEFSNLTGCKVQLLGKKYMIKTPIIIRGNTALEGTVMGPSQLSDSASSQQGTVIEASGSVNAINIETQGTDSNLDCLRFWINNLNIRHSGTGIVINIFSTAGNTFTSVRSGYITNIKIRQENIGGYGILVHGGSYLKFDNISINGGSGVKVSGDGMKKYVTEFLWFNKVLLGNVAETSFEITQGNNLYLTEIDTNDSKIGLLINNDTGETFNVFVNRFNSARCGIGIKLNASKYFMSRIKVSEATIHQTSSGITPVAALYFEKRPNSSNYVSECLFENINIDAIENQVPTGYRAIMEMGNSLEKCRFLNIRCGRKNQLQDSTSQLLLIGIKQSGIYTANGGINKYTIPITTSSPFPNKPIVMVQTNQNIPYSVETTNTPGKESNIYVTFSTAPTGPVALSYFLTGYYSTYTLPLNKSIVEFKNPGTHSWFVPAGVKKADIFLVGGGGGGAGHAYGAGTSGNGGNGGVCAYHQGVNLTPGSAIAIVVGAGGNGGAYNAYGGNGGQTSFGDYKVAGGNGGLRPMSSQLMVEKSSPGGNAVVGKVGNPGADGTICPINSVYYGGGGGAGTSAYHVNAGQAPGGKGDGGAGGAGANNTITNNGGNGTNGGGGGGGAFNSAHGYGIGGNGGNGLVIIRYWS